MVEVESTTNIDVEREVALRMEMATNIALGGGLGALAAILILLLVGVVLGWVWYCYKKRGKSNSQERCENYDHAIMHFTFLSTYMHV